MSQDPETDPVFSKLLEVTYSSTADPALYDDLIQVWENYMARQPDIDHDGPHLPHFKKALQIFSTMGRRRRRQSRNEELLAAFSTPAMICTRDMAVQAANAAARDVLDSAGNTAPTDPDLARAIQGLGGARRTDIVPMSDPQGRLTDCAVISLQDGAPTDEVQDASKQTCLVVLTKPASPDSPAWTQLAARFELSQAEAAVLHALLAGVSPDEVADARGVSVNTVRSQIRKLLYKTGASSTSDLIRTTLLICTQLDTVAMATRLSGQTVGARDDDLRSVLTRDRRILSYREMGDRDGRPLLFLHNMMGGTALPPHVQRMARMCGWRVIAPSRPGFGASDSVALKGMALVERTVRDCRELLDHLEVDNALVLGLMSSAGLAVTFAHSYPRRCAAMLNVAHAR